MSINNKKIIAFNSFIILIKNRLVALEGTHFLRHLVQITCLNSLHAACKRAGLRNIGWHSLRHTFASHLAMRGITMIALQQLLDHSSISTTMIYAHLSQSVLTNAIKLLELPSKELPTLLFPISSSETACSEK